MITSAWARALRALSRPYVGIAVAAALFVVCGAARAADPLEPGLWKVVTSVNMNGMQGPVQTKTRCLKPEDARDLERTFTPEYGVQGSTCERMNVAWLGQKLAWRILCTGALSMEVAGAYEFDSPRHYTGVVTMLGSIAGRETRTRTTLEAERIGECGAEDGSQKTEDRNQKSDDRK